MARGHYWGAWSNNLRLFAIFTSLGLPQQTSNTRKSKLIERDRQRERESGETKLEYFYTLHFPSPGSAGLLTRTLSYPALSCIVLLTPCPIAKANPSSCIFGCFLEFVKLEQEFNLQRSPTRHPAKHRKCVHVFVGTRHVCTSLHRHERA